MARVVRAWLCPSNAKTQHTSAKIEALHVGQVIIPVLVESPVDITNVGQQLIANLINVKVEQDKLLKTIEEIVKIRNQVLEGNVYLGWKQNKIA